MQTTLISTVALISLSISSCQKCADCIYYEEMNDSIYLTMPYEEPLCGDEYRALEKKTYSIPGNPKAVGFNECAILK